MITVKRKYEICKALQSIPIQNLENFLISKEGKIYYVNLETEEIEDISSIVSDYTKKGIPIYEIKDPSDNTKYLKIKLDKLLLNTFIGEMQGKIIYKDGYYRNCTLDNLKYEIDITNTINNDILYINNKEFKKIMLPNGRENKDLFISNDGIIYNNFYKKLSIKTITDKLYFAISINGKSYFYHRLVYPTRVGEIPEGLTINHKDGNKRNNHYTNLEVLTSAENFRHVQNNGLRHNAKWTEENIHIICKMMEDNKLFPEIANYFNILDKVERARLSETLGDLRKGTIWKDISSLYKIENYDTTRPGCYSGITTEQVESVCELLEKKFPVVDISKKLDISIHIISNIKHGLSWKEISSKYNIENYYKSQLTSDKAYQICEMLETNCPVGEISEKLDVSRSTIHNIKSGKGYKDISCNYNFIKDKPTK